MAIFRQTPFALRVVNVWVETCVGQWCRDPLTLATYTMHLQYFGIEPAFSYIFLKLFEPFLFENHRPNFAAIDPINVEIEA